MTPAQVWTDPLDRDTAAKVVDVLDGLVGKVGMLSLPEAVKRIMMLLPAMRRQLDELDPLLTEDLEEGGDADAREAAEAGGLPAGDTRRDSKSVTLWDTVAAEAADFAAGWTPASGGDDDDDDARHILHEAGSGGGGGGGGGSSSGGGTSSGGGMARLRDFVAHLVACAEDDGNLGMGMPASRDVAAAGAGAAAGTTAAGSHPHHHPPAPTRRAAGSDAVWVGTVHQAKGLQWRSVFVACLNVGVLPPWKFDPPCTCGEDGYGGSDDDALVAQWTPPVQLRSAVVRSASGVRPPVAATPANFIADALLGDFSGSPTSATHTCGACRAAEEERRVLYVAASRACDMLHCTYTVDVPRTPFLTPALPADDVVAPPPSRGAASASIKSVLYD